MIFYSDLTDRVEEQLMRILEFLAVSVTKEEMKCAMSRKEGIYKRQKRRNVTGLVFGDQLTQQLIERRERVLKLDRQKFNGV